MKFNLDPLALGAGLGAAFGLVVMDGNIAIGCGMGVAIGYAFKSQKSKNTPAEEPSPEPAEE